MIPSHLIWLQTQRREAIDAIGLQFGDSHRAEAVHATLADLPGLVRRCPPALLRLPEGGYLAVVGDSRHGTLLVGPSLAVESVRHSDIVDALGNARWQAARQQLSELRAAIGTTTRSAQTPSRCHDVRDDRLLSAALANDRRLVRAFTEHQPVEVGELFSRQPSIGQLGRRWTYQLVSLLALHTVGQGLWIASWAVLGHAILARRIEPGWLLAWSLLLLTQLPFRSSVSWLQSTLALRFMAEVKTRFLRGSMALDPAMLRGHGVGHFMGRALEADALSRLTLDGGFSALLAVVEIILALAICHQGAGGSVQLMVLLATLAAASLLAGLEWTQRSRWTSQRISLAESLVDTMIGHRTRLAQFNPQAQDRDETAITGYLREGRAMDSTQRKLGLLPRVWMLLSVLTLAPSWISGTATPGAMAIGVGASFLGYRALERGTRGLSQLAAALIAWRQVSAIIDLEPPTSDPLPFPSTPSPSSTRSQLGVENPLAALTSALPSGPTLHLSDIDVYRDQGSRPILSRCSLDVFPDDRILLQGSSGSGKSTLAAIAAGLRTQDAGLRLFHGLDLPGHGASRWRRAVALAPQFHENHVFSDTLAFNLLMGRGWPPSQHDLEEAEKLCRELGLGDLLDRMPAGLFQAVGDTGWQLSHGERGRVFLARALLQNSELLILDETLGALDPLSYERALEVVDQRVSSLVVIDQGG